MPDVIYGILDSFNREKAVTKSKAVLALFGGKKTVTSNQVSPAWPHFSKKAIGTVANLLSEGKGISLGQSKIAMDTEARFAKYHGVRYALALSSGTAALQCAVAGCNIAPGDEVITTPYSWGASTGCILSEGAIPIFADVLEETGLIDPASVENKITKRTRGVLVVHIYGQPCDMRPLRAIARKHKLPLIEDCSQAHGAVYRGRRVGGFGQAAGFSCMGGKPLAATEMGMFITDDRDTYDRALLSSMHPQRQLFEVKRHGGGMTDAYRKYADSLSASCRTSDVNCVLLMDQLPNLKKWNRNRVGNRDDLACQVSDIEFIRFPKYPKHVKPTYHMATMRYDETKALGVTRETFMTALRAEGVFAMTYVSDPIPNWRRMNAKSYDGPANLWIPALKRAGVRYDPRDIPVCMKLSKKTSVQMSFNNLIEPEKRLIKQYARAFHKVAGNLPILLKWQAKR